MKAIENFNFSKTHQNHMQKKGKENLIVDVTTWRALRKNLNSAANDDSQFVERPFGELLPEENAVTTTYIPSDIGIKQLKLLASLNHDFL